MKLNIFFAVGAGLLLMGCSGQPSGDTMNTAIAQGQMPNLTSNTTGELFMVYGNGENIMYTSSVDQGNTFSEPAMVATLPHLAASHSRGPQLVATGNGLAMIALNNEGDIFSYQMDKSGAWTQTSKVNDVDTVAKEGLAALAADGNSVLAIWLDLRSRNNQLYGARSVDGGKTWSKNMLIYASPDTTVCECCKPSVVMKGNDVHVMFRNWLNGNRDLYLISSKDGGATFGQAQKLGTGSWALDGCPMDGGGLAIGSKSIIETVWRRQGNIYTCEPGQAEKQIGEGKNCTIALAGGKNVYAWTENGEVVCVLPNGKKQVLGKGKLPILKAIDDHKVICAWENEKQIHRSVIAI